MAKQSEASKAAAKRSLNVKPVSEMADEELFFNREVTWLEFNRRVLAQALDERIPLLMRVRFLAIFNSNLDEFYMKRVGGLKRQVALGVTSRSPDGLTGEEMLQQIRETTVPMLEQQAEAYNNQIKPALAEEGIHLLEWEDLSEDEKERANKYYTDNVFPVLTPLAVDPGHPFPFLSNLSLSLGVMLKSKQSDEKMFSRIKVPEVLPAWIRVNDESESTYKYILLRKVIENNLDNLYVGMDVVDVMAFRVTRNADIDRDEEDAEDLLEMIEKELRQRRFANVVRIEHGPNPNPWMLSFLMRELGLSKDDVYEMGGKLDYTVLNTIADIDRPELQLKPWKPQVPVRLADPDVDIFSVIREQDVFLHHPYECFGDSVERFVKAAADDPDVLAIKMTVYRTGDNSPFIRTLIRAAEQGKQVVCLVELKARFDEERNIYWAQVLEKAGVHVVYGVVGLKTHTKTALIVRREKDQVRCYAHIGTGNYHSGTAKLYTDMGILTCNPTLTSDVVDLFHHLTGRSQRKDYRKLLIAPVNMRKRFNEMIDREVANHKAGKPAGIIAKFNSLEDKKICRKLYEASQAGLSVDLIVRGFCTLKPGVPGLSENIRVISVIGRFLEHSRIYFFKNGSDDPLEGEYYIGSADWMYRNLNSRVEAITPIEDRFARQRLWEVLETMMKDQYQAWDMHADGSYVLRYPAEDADEVARMGTHETMMKMTLKEQGF